MCSSQLSLPEGYTYLNETSEIGEEGRLKVRIAEVRDEDTARVSNVPFIHFRYLYSAPSRFLLRGAPDYSADTESEFHAEAHEQLRMKELPRVPTRRLEVDSNPQPSGCKAPNIPLHGCGPNPRNPNPRKAFRLD